MTDTKAYFAECQVCDEADTLTPLQYAFKVMDIRNPEHQALMLSETAEADAGTADTLPDTWFGNGWIQGIEGATDGALACPVGIMEQTGAWLVGFLSGRYASEMDFHTPVCRLHEVGNHQPDTCDATYVTGAGLDPYSTGCGLPPGHYPATDHDGPNPLGGEGRVQWRGGGSAAGDALPYTDVKWLD